MSDVYAGDPYPLLERLAYQAWLDRGQPIGSPDVDWQRAMQLLEQRREANRATAPTAVAPVLSDAVSEVAAKKLRIRAKSKRAAVGGETPLEVPPSTPPAPPTPTQAAVLV